MSTNFNIQSFDDVERALLRRAGQARIYLTMADKTGGAGASVLMNFGSDDVTLAPRMPFACEIVGGYICVDVDPDASFATMKITDGTSDLTDSVIVAAADGDGEVYTLTGNGTQAAQGAELVLDITEDAPIGVTFTGSVILAIKQIPPDSLTIPGDQGRKT
jgi:hypothetical protein